MKRVILIDDEPLARSVIKEYLQDYPEISVVAECSNGFEGVKAIQEHKPDLIFLDIQMPKINGFEMLEVLDNPPAVIFTTAYDEYALRAFEANALDYLLKPFTRERFAQALNKWKTSHDQTGSDTREVLANMTQPEERNRIIVRFNGEIRIIPSAEVYYFEAFDDYVKIFTKDDYFLKKKTLSHFEEVLDPARFMRVHRSFLLNLDHLTKIEPYEKNGHIALLKNGRTVPLSRNGYSRVRELLGL